MQDNQHSFQMSFFSDRNNLIRAEVGGDQRSWLWDIESYKYLYLLMASCRGETLSSITILTETLAPSRAVMTVLFVNMRKLQVCMPTFGDTFVIIS